MRQKRTKTRPEHLTLRNLMGIGWGCKTRSGMWQHKKENIQNAIFHNGKKIRLPSNTMLDQHLTGELTLYYSPEFTNRKPMCVCVIDTDMKIGENGEFRGDPADVPKWHDELTKLVAGIKSFASPGGWGLHTPIGIVAGKKYEFLSTYEKNYYGRMKLKQLENELNSYAKNKGFKLTKVELKGTPILVDHSTKTVQCGQLVALPRTKEHVDFVGSDQLIKLTFAQLDKLIHFLNKFNKKFVKPENKINKQVATKNVGSPCLKIVNPESYGEFALSVVGEDVRSRDGRYVCNADDFSAFISVVEGITQADLANLGFVKQMSFARIEALWTAAYEAGDLSVAFCARKVTAMRDALSKAGFVDWIDNEYAAGKACVFRISVRFFQCFSMFTAKPEHTHTTCMVTKDLSEHKIPVFVGEKCPSVVKAKAWMDLEEQCYGIICC